MSWNDFIKKRLQHRNLYVNIVKFLKTVFFYRKPPAAVSGHLHYFLTLLFLLLFPVLQFYFSYVHRYPIAIE